MGSSTLFDIGGGGSNPLTTTGDMVYSSSGSLQTRLPIGTANQQLKVSNGLPVWGPAASGGVNYVNANPDFEVDSTGYTTYTDQQTVTMTLATPAVCTVASTTGFYVGMPFCFTTTGALPTGVSQALVYFISTIVSSTTFQFSATLGGAAVNSSVSQSGTHNFHPAVPVQALSATTSGTALTTTNSSPLRGTRSGLITQANSPANVTATFTNSSSTITTVSPHLLQLNQLVYFTTSGSLPTNFSANTPYYVLTMPLSTSFTVSATINGSAVVAGSAGSGTQTLVTAATGSASASGLCAGNGVYYAFTIDAADKAKPLTISFDFNADTNFSPSNGTTTPNAMGAGDSDIEVFIYDVTNTVLIPVSPQVITSNGSNNFNFQGTFQTASNSTSYKLCWHSAKLTAPVTGWNLKLDNVFVGPAPAVKGSPIQDWVSYTPTFGAGFGTATGVNFYYRRVGDSLEVQGFFTSGTTAASLASLSLPLGLSIDTNKIYGTNTTSNAGQIVGTMAGNAANQYASIVLAPATSTTLVYFSSELASAITIVPSNGNGFLSSTTAAGVWFKVPISGWSSSMQMSQDASTRVVAAAFSCSAATQTPGAGAQINFDSKIYDTHAAVTTGAGAWKFTAPVAGIYSMTGAVNYSSVGGYLQIRKNGSAVAYLSAVGTAAGSTTLAPLNYDINLVSGDYIDVITVSATVVAGGAAPYSSHIEIKRQSGPSTIAATETVSARYYASGTSLSGSLATISWTTKDWDDHAGMSAGVYTVTVAGKYQVNTAVRIAATFAAGNASVLEIQKNSTVVSRDTQNAGGIQGDVCVASSDIINCLAGDTIRVQVSSAATGPSIVSSNFDNFISIVRVGN